MSVEFLIGADPELFVRDRAGNLVSAYGMIPGTKSNPHKVEGGAVQVDGMALEFNIDPANNFKDFNNNIVNVLRQLKEMIPDGYSFDFSPVAMFGKDYIESQPQEARELGCDPDYNAFTALPNPKPDASLDFRTASGHIHIGWTNGQDVDVPEHMEACIMAVKQLDMMVGLASRKWDKDTLRSQMYGKFSTFRPKHYGVEYRTLSNMWVDNEDRRKFIFQASMEAMELLMSGKRLYESYYIPDFDYWVQQKSWSDLLYYSAHAMKINGSRSLRKIYDNLNNDEVASEILSLQRFGWEPPQAILDGVQEVDEFEDDFDDGVEAFFDEDGGLELIPLPAAR